LDLVAALEFERFRDSEIVHSYGLRWSVIMSVNQFGHCVEIFSLIFIVFGLGGLIKREEVIELGELAFTGLHIYSFSYTKLILLVESHKNLTIIS
jgi:hypothetical protein